MQNGETRRKHLKRMAVWLTAMVFIVIFCRYQNQHLTVSYYTYENAKLPSDFQDFRIVQISDLHNAVFGKDNKRLLAGIRELDPELLVITGDVVDSNHTDIRVAMEFVREAAGICPVYYVTGNHENWLSAQDMTALMDSFTQSGAVILTNRAVEITKGESSICLIGLADEHLSDGTLNQILSGADRDELLLLLAHEPQYLDRYSASGVDLALTGHAHGGQFRLPFIGPLVAPDQGFFPKYTEGEHHAGDTTMIISRGLGNSIIPVRLFNFPEIVCVELINPDAN